MFQHNLWHRALKLNKGIYKTTETVSDAEILKKQLREQANEILSTISVFCHRETSSPDFSSISAPDSYKLKADSFPNLHSALSAPSASPEVVPLSLREIPRSGTGGPTSKHSPSASLKFQVSSYKFHDFYVPESEICLLLLLDKITVLKTFLFLAKEHNFFNEEKHQILTAACVHLAESAQSELHDADIFSHPVFHSDPSASPENSSPAENRSPEIQDSKFKIQDSIPPASPLNANRYPLNASPDSSPLNANRYPLNASPDSSPLNANRYPLNASPNASPEEETLLDILNTDLNQMSDKNLSDISDPSASPLNANRYTLNASPNASPLNAERYLLNASLKKSRQNKKTFKSYLPKFLNISPKQQNHRNPLSASLSPDPAPSISYKLKADSFPLNSSPSASAEIPQNTPSSVAVDEFSQIDFLAAYSAPSAFPDISPFGGSLAGRQDSRFKIQDSAPAPLNPNRYTLNANRFPLTSRQQKLYDFLLQNNQSKIGDLTRIFDQKISEKTIRRDLQVLINNSLITQSGSRRWTYYSVKF